MASAIADSSGSGSGSGSGSAQVQAQVQVQVQALRLAQMWFRRRLFSNLGDVWFVSRLLDSGVSCVLSVNQVVRSVELLVIS